MKMKQDKALRHIKIKDELHGSLKHLAVDSKQSLQDYVNKVLENFIKNNLTQVTN